MHPLTAIDLQRRTVDEQRREALAVANPTDEAAPAEPDRRRRIRLPRLLRRRVRTA